MLRAALLSSLFLLPSLALAADLPKDITAEERADLVAKARKGWLGVKAGHLKQIEDAKELMKFKATEKEGKAKLANAEVQLKALEQSTRLVGGPYLKMGEPARGLIVRIYEGEFIAEDVRADGVVVHGLLRENMEIKPKTYVRYFIASALKAGKGKKLPPAATDGLWFVAGVTTVGDDEIPVLYRFELTKAEVAAIKAKDEPQPEKK